MFGIWIVALRMGRGGRVRRSPSGRSRGVGFSCGLLVGGVFGGEGLVSDVIDGDVSCCQSVCM